MEFLPPWIFLRSFRALVAESRYLAVFLDAATIRKAALFIVQHDNRSARTIGFQKLFSKNLKLAHFDMDSMLEILR